MVNKAAFLKNRLSCLLLAYCLIIFLLFSILISSSILRNLLFEKQSSRCFYFKYWYQNGLTFAETNCYKKKSPELGIFFNEIFKSIKILNAKTFATSATAAGIWIIKIKSFAIKPVTEFERSIYEI